MSRLELLGAYYLGAFTETFLKIRTPGVDKIFWIVIEV